MSTENMKFDIIKLLRYAVQNKISDIHLKIGSQPYIRKNGKIFKLNFEPMSENNVKEIIDLTMPKILADICSKKFDLDYSFELKDFARFRINMGRELSKICFVIRIIPFQIPTVKELNLPHSILELTKYNNGIVLVTGATGAGKSTTIASLLDFININKQKHIITLEDPIEFIYENKKSIVTQRQIGADTLSFEEGLKYSLRQDPDVILIGEIRDKDSLINALKASETGHLVFATLHTVDAKQTVNRLLNMFKSEDRDMIRGQFAENLRGIISQKLLPTKMEDRRPACEVLINTPTVSDLISKDKINDIYEILKNNTFDSMFTLNMSLFKMVHNEVIDKEVALEFSNDKIELEQMLRGVIINNSGWENI